MSRVISSDVSNIAKNYKNHESVDLPSESVYSLRLKEWSRQIPVAKLSTEWEQCILNLIPSRLKNRHPKCVEKNLREIRGLYEKEMVNCSIESIVGTLNEDTNEKLVNKTILRSFDDNYEYNVPRQRQLLANKYFLSNNIMKQIIELANEKLARVVVDLDDIVEGSSDDYFEISMLEDQMINEVGRVAWIIKNEYYPEVVKIITATLHDNPNLVESLTVGDRKCVKKDGATGEVNKKIKLLRCATNLFTQQIVTMMIRTIDELTKRLADYRRKCPRLKIRLIWKTEDSRLSIEPPIFQIYSIWHSLVRAVENIADDLPAFEYGTMFAAEQLEPMKIALPDWYSNEGHHKIDEALGKAINPLKKHFIKIADDFEAVTSAETTQKIETLISPVGQVGIADNVDIDYRSSIKVLTEQNEQANNISEILDSFDIGQLDQRPARTRLIDEIADTRRVLIEGMLRRHEEYNENICQDFENLRDKLLDIPDTAHELFKLSEMVAYPSMSRLLEGFEVRVTKSIEMLNSLLALTSDMSEKHVLLNGATINWLADIKPIITKSNTLCEAMKSELEDELQRRIARLNLEIEVILPKFEILDYMDDPTKVDDYADHIRDLVGHLNGLDQQIQEINYEENLFKFPETSFSSVEEIREILMPVNTLNNLVREWRRDHAVWLYGPFEYINAVEVREKTIHHYRETFEQLNGSLRVKIKNDLQQSSSSGGASTAKRLKLYTGIVDDPDPMQQPAPLTMCTQVLEQVKRFESHLELIDCVCNPSLRERHWNEISLIYQQSRRMSKANSDRSASLASTFVLDLSKDTPIDATGESSIAAPDAGTTLAKLVRLDLAKDIEKYRVISIGANKELALANRFNEMRAQWDTVDFSIDRSQSSPVAIKTFLHLDEIESLIEEHETIISEMRVSYFVKPIAQDLVKFSRSLDSLNSVVKSWLRIQKDWHSFDKVFSQKTTNTDLARAHEHFFSIRSDVIQVVEQSILQEPKFRAIVTVSPKLTALLVQGEETLESVRHTVQVFLQDLKKIFPRFYFISDLEVIDIVFESKFPKKMRLLVRKCFTNMSAIKCSPSGFFKDYVNGKNGHHWRVTSIINSSGQEFVLSDPFKDQSNGESDPGANGPFVGPFITVEETIRHTMRDAITRSFCSFLDWDKLHDEKDRKDSHKLDNGKLEKFLSILTDGAVELAGTCSLHVFLTMRIEKVMDHRETGIALAVLKSYELEHSKMIEVMLAELRGNDVSRTRRRRLVFWILQIWEQRDVMKLMMGKVVKGGGKLARGDFAWRAQIRHYWRDSNVTVSILDSEEAYGYEYNSGIERDSIIRTPLTERCYHSLIEAHRNRRYGLVYGPGAIGKTRTIEALARILGVNFRIFDCAQGHLDNYHYMDSVLLGLTGCSSSIRSSCWILFKNLDHVKVQGLSVLAQRITSLTGMMENRSFITGTISIQPGILPPKYRSPLPDAVKIFFRPVAFAFPDTKRIVEISLFAEGFSTAATLAEKLGLFEKYLIRNTSSFMMIRGFSDFGMTTTKSLVKTACALKTRYPNETEKALFLRALVDVYLPKITRQSDLAAFQHVIDDLFPNVALRPPNYENLMAVIRRVLGEVGMLKNDQDPYLTLILKVIQFFELLLARQVIVVVGSALAGKTTIIETLARSLSQIDHGVFGSLPGIDCLRINHDSYTNEELFGTYEGRSESSRRLCWKDGILTRALRGFTNTARNPDVRMKNKRWQWLVLDGPLHPALINKITPLVDANERTLILESGEKIPLGESMSIVFETSSTIKATPATISRCGIIYIDESSTIHWKTRIKAWIIERHTNHSSLVPSSSSGEHRNGKTSPPEEYKDFLQSLLEWSLDKCLRFLQKKLVRHQGALPMDDNQLVMSVLRLLEIFLTEASGLSNDGEAQLSKNSPGISSGDQRNLHEKETKHCYTKNFEDERMKLYTSNFFAWSQAAVLMSIIWGLGGSFHRDARVALDEFCRSIWRTNVDFPHDFISAPSEGLIEDNIYIFSVGTSGSGCWKHSLEAIKRANVVGDKIDYFWNSKANATSYVSTIDSVRYMSIFETHVKSGKPFLVSGETATGKTLYLRHLLKTKMASKGYQAHFHSFGADASVAIGSAGIMQNLIISKMRKVSKRVYEPSNQAKFCINFVDDMSVVTPSKDEAVLRELIRQYYEPSHPDGCWRDVDTGDRIRIDNVIFLGAIDPSADHRHSNIDEFGACGLLEAGRFFRHFNLYCIDPPTVKSIFQISYNKLLANLRSNLFNADVSGGVTSIVNATIEVYTSIVQQLKSVPSKLQYQFNLRDVSRLIDGCSLIHKESAETKVTLMRLWVHEMIRVFADRIIDPTDAEWFFDKMKESAASHFKDNWDTVFDNLPKNTTSEGLEQLTRESFQHLVFSNFMRLPDTPRDIGVIRNSINGTMGPGENAAVRQHHRYEEITSSRDGLKNRALFYLERYNDQVTDERKLDLLVFPQMLEHLIRICRILDIPGASLLMICFGASSGRRSLTALAAHIKSQRFEELSCGVIESMMTSNSPHGTWREDFKRACLSCIEDSSDELNDILGAVNVRINDCTFFISDREIIGSTNCSSILSDVCSLMKTGQTSGTNFFTREEQERIVETCRLLAQKGDRNQEMNSLQVLDYFYHKCQEKLHFVLYFDKSGMSRRSQLGGATFSKILNHCTIDCYGDWPAEALYEIGTRFMKDVDIENRVKSVTITVSKYFWDSVIIGNGNVEGTNINQLSTSHRLRRLPVAAYIHMVKLYGLSINKRQNEIRVSREKYLSGLDKLKSADEEVRKMRSTLTRLRPELESSARETTETMRKIETENVSVEMATIQVKREEEAANEIAEVASILKEECEADLAVAIPILEDAIAALNTLKPTDITLVKAMKNPPDTVKLVLAAVCVMLGVPPDRSTDPVTGKKSIDYWAPSKRILGDMNFLQNLKDYDKDNIPPSVMSVVNKSYMNDESFMPHIVAKASSAAEGLCKWVRAMVSYDEVAKVVAPKKEKLATAERECNAILEYLNEKRTSLAALNDKLAALNASLQATLAKKLQLENEVASCTGKLKRAEALIASLAGEKARWLDAAETLTRTCDNLAGDVLLSCGLIALLSSLSVQQRDSYITEWRGELDRLGIPNSGKSYTFLGSLRSSLSIYASSSGILEDSTHRLSLNSSFNQANTLILEHSLLWPFILDPQNQANIWIKRVEASNGLVVVKPTSPRWFVQIRECIEKNQPVLLENLDSSEYLQKTPAILRYFGTFSVPSYFRLYMTSRISSSEASGSHRLDEPHDMYKRFCVVNFTLANEALEDRLLEIIVSRERPELRNTFDRLMMTSTTNRRLLDQEENQILEILSGASVNIIEDERAIEKLDRWKQLSHEMKMREAETVKATELEMDELRSTYRPLTKYCAALYDTLAYLVNFNHMYRFSLDWFVRLYVRSIDTSMRSVFLHKRLRYLGSSFTLTLDASVRNALLDEHKLLYSFLLSIKILLDSERMHRTELRALFHTNVVDCKCEEDYSLGIESAANTPSSGARDIKFLIGQQLSNALPKVFQNLPKSFQEKSSIWNDYCNGKKDEGLPAPWDSELTDFQRLILVNRLRPEKTLNEVLRLVENTLGWNSITTSSTRIRDNIIARSYDESSCVVPLIFVLPSYREPHGLVQKWARTIGFSSGMQRFSMPPCSSAEYLEIEGKIDAARRHGGWVLLENCHLASDEWLAKLESISETVGNNDDSALSFRLWLTSYPSTNFPISILHDGTKIYCEQPGDQIKQSLLDFYANEPLDDPDFYKIRSTGNNARTFSKLVYALCFFHAIVIGRQRFHNLAWNVASYEFTDSDLQISIGHLHRAFYIDRRETFIGHEDQKQDVSGSEEDLVENLIYLVGECYHGGRILDPTDRDCLKVILQDCCNNELIQSTNNYIFKGGDRSSINGYEYSVPNRTEYRDFVRHIKECLPIGEPPPGIFGLDDNAAVLRDYQNSDYFVHSLARSLLLIDNDISVHPDEPVRPKLLDVVHDIRTKLSLESSDDHSNACFDVECLKIQYPITYKEPLNSVLVEQVEIYNRLIAVIGATLSDVEATISDAEYGIIDALTQNKVPGKWMMIGGMHLINSIDCSTLFRFIDALCSRRNFFISWIENGHYKGSLWIGGLINRKTLLLAARLTFSRKVGIPLNRLAINYEVTNVKTDHCEPSKFVAVTSDSTNVIHIHGLYLSGARWDLERSTLVETTPKLYWNPMPTIRLVSSSLDSLRMRSNQQKTSYYACPLNSSPTLLQSSTVYFLGSLSTNYITTIPLESKDTEVRHWIKRRTLLFCNK